jgi:soluble P-type ATPase
MLCRKGEKMLRIPIPGRDELVIENVVFDFNGTLAADGKIKPEVKEMIGRIRELADVFILTSDTYGSVVNECRDLGVTVRVLNGSNCSPEKRDFVERLGTGSTICVGNGMNDIDMFDACALSFIIIGEEGCSARALLKADIAVGNITDALAMILNPRRITATLRR